MTAANPLFSMDSAALLSIIYIFSNMHDFIKSMNIGIYLYLFKLQ